MKQLIKLLPFVFIFWNKICAQLTDEIPDGCDISNINPSCEPIEGIFTDFMNQLELHSGMGTDSYTVNVVCNGETRSCVIDSKGNAVWDAQMLLYDKQVNPDLNTTTAMANCFNQGYKLSDFNACMETVRNNMIFDLNDSFDKNVIDLIQENDCESFDIDCIIE